MAANQANAIDAAVGAATPEHVGTPPKGSPTPGESEPAALHVLLVEDDVQDARLLEAQLVADNARSRVTVEHATSLAEAHEALRSPEGAPFDAVLLDLGLPDSTGLETYTSLAGLAPDLPMVVLSGDTDRDIAVDAVRHGAQDFLVKGLVSGEVVSRVLRYAVERGRLLNRQRDQATRQQLLAELGRLALGADEPGPLLQAAMETLQEGLGVDRVHLVERVDDGFRLRAGIGWDVMHRRVLIEPGRDSWAGYATLTGETVVVQDVKAERPFGLGALLADHPPRSGVVVPVSFQYRPWGAVGAFADTPRGLTDSDVSFVEHVAGLVGTTIQRLRVEDARIERVKELTALQGIAHAVQRNHLSTGQMARRAAEELLPSFQFPDITVAAVEIAGERCELSAQKGAGMVTSLSAEIATDGRTLGMVEVGYSENRPFLAEEQDLLDAAAESLAAWLTRGEAIADLRASQRRLDLTLSQLPALVYTLDEDLRFTSVTGKVLEERGQDAGELIGRPVSVLLAEQGLEGSDETLEVHRAAVAGTPGDFAVETASARWEGAVEPLTDADGGPAGVVGLALDATERRERERALAASTARLRALFQNASDAILLADDDGNYLDANPAALRLLGYSRDELLGMSVIDVVAGTETDLHDTWQEFERHGSQDGEVLLRRKDGQTVIAGYNAVRNIQPGVHLSIMRDITDHVQAQIALRRSEDRFRQLAENAAEGILRVELKPEGRYTYVNPALERITGYSEPEIFAHPRLLNDRLHPADRSKPRDVVDPSNSIEQPLLLRFRRADDTWVWLEMYSSPVYDRSGELEAVHGLVVDVTDRKRQAEALEDALRQERKAAERLRELDRMREGFLRAVSHELRTPLTSVYAGTLTLRDNAENLAPERQHDLLERVFANAERLRQLLDDLVDVDRFSSGTADVQLEQVDLSVLAAAVVEQYGLTDVKEHIDVDLDATPLPIMADVPKLHRAVEQLIDNAVKHTPTGTRIWLRTRRSSEGCVLTVEDDGPGVEDELKTHVFEPFRQGRASDSLADPGTGIGLALVEGCVRVHGGRVWVEDRPGGGASFQILLPRATDGADRE